MTSVISESYYLIESNRNKCSSLLKKKNLSPNDICDFLISLHIVLEVSINSLFREIIINNLQKTISKEKIVDDLDKLSFIDKVIFFILFSKFNFNSEIDKANNYYSIIGKLKDFTEPRNKLLHGAMVGSFADSDSITHTANLLTPENKEKQIKSFKDILEGLRFYCNCLINTNIDEDKINYLFDINFLK